MAESYTVFWTMDRWLSALSAGHKPLPVLFGGPRLAEPSFRRAGVKVGDLLYPVAVWNRRVYVVARMRVREMILLSQEDGPTLINERFPQFRAWKVLAPTCTDEVIIGIEGTGAPGRSGAAGGGPDPAELPLAARGAVAAPRRGRSAEPFGRPAGHLPTVASLGRGLGRPDGVAVRPAADPAGAWPTGPGRTGAGGGVVSAALRR